VTRDLTCAGVAIYLGGGPDQIVNLNGHTIASTPPGSVTIRVEGAYIEHGRIQGGVGSFEGLGSASFNDVVLEDGGIGNGAIVRNSTLIDSGIGSSRDTIDIEGSTLIDSSVSGWESYETAIGNTFINSTLEVDALLPTVDDERNSFTGGGIIVDNDGGGVPGTIANNTIVGTSGDGISLGEGSGVPFGQGHHIGLLISHNQVSYSGGDGIDLQPAGGPMNVTLTGNKLVNNAKYGIESPGNTPPSIIITDGGGNVTKGNGAGQCLNINCGN
jgi:hypothetical protein